MKPIAGSILNIIKELAMMTVCISVINAVSFFIAQNQSNLGLETKNNLRKFFCKGYNIAAFAG